jgi:hypothetical protein
MVVGILEDWVIIVIVRIRIQVFAGARSVFVGITDGNDGVLGGGIPGGNISHLNDAVVFVVVLANLVVVGVYGRRAIDPLLRNEGCGIGVLSCSVFG